MIVRRRIVSVVLVVSALVLPACGSGRAGGEPAPTSAVPSGQLPTASAAPFAVPGYPAYANPAMLETVSTSGDTAVVRHKYGEVEIPRRPLRVYADPAAFAIATNLKLPLVAVDYYPGSEHYPGFAASVAGVDAKPLDGEANAERIAAAKPDLILAPMVVGEEQLSYDVVSKIAPTVVFDSDSFAFWPRAIADLGAALGIDTTSLPALAGFDAAVTTTCADLRAVVGDDTVQVVPMFGTTAYVEGPGQQTSGIGYVPAADTRWLYEYCRLKPPPALAAQLKGEQWAEVSLELLPEYLTADHLFVLFESDKDRTDFSAIEKNPLWTGLKAVKAGQAYKMPRLAAADPDSALFTIAEAHRATQS